MCGGIASLTFPGLAAELSALELSGGTQPAGRTQTPAPLTIPSGNRGSGGQGMVLKKLIALITSSLPSVLGTFHVFRRALSLSLSLSEFSPLELSGGASPAGRAQMP